MNGDKISLSSRQAAASSRFTASLDSPSSACRIHQYPNEATAAIKRKATAPIARGVGAAVVSALQYSSAGRHPSEPITGYSNAPIMARLIKQTPGIPMTSNKPWAANSLAASFVFLVMLITDCTVRIYHAPNSIVT